MLQNILLIAFVHHSFSQADKWCVAKQEATDAQLQANIDWVCSQGIDCKEISPGGKYFDNNNIMTRSSFIMNQYYQSKGGSEEACNFNGTGIVVTTYPSTSTCDVSGVAGESYMGGSSSSIDTPSSNSKWCVAKQETTDTQLQANIDWVCNTQGIDCKSIFPGPEGYCSNETLKTRATYAMSAYYMSRGLTMVSCEFNGSAIVSTTNPSTYSCFISSGPQALSSCYL